MRDNYSFKKYQKELARKKKREEKLQNKLNKKNQQASAQNTGEAGSAPSPVEETPAE